MTMTPERAQELALESAKETQKMKTFLDAYAQKRKDAESGLQAFDSLMNEHPLGEAVAKHNLPQSLKHLLESKPIQAAQKFLSTFQQQFDGAADSEKTKLVEVAATVSGEEAVFDGIELGMAEYARRNGGETPPVEVVLAGINAATNAFTEFATETNAKQAFDSLSFEHHEALSVVPAQITVTIMTAIANSLPIVAQLPNPTGSNEVPLIYGRTTANMRMGVFHKDELIDGKQAGMPYLENRHTLLMTAAANVFSTPIHVGYDKVVNANHSISFKVDTSTKKAPFLGGRVKILVKGVEVANSHNKQHATKGGIDFLQPKDGKPVVIDGKEYLVTSGRADLDNHTVEVTFESAKTVPVGGEVEVQVVFDYERKDSDGKYILTPPGVDMNFGNESLYASPMRALVAATIDAITQMQNELGLPWDGAVLAIIQQKYYLEQTSRLLREMTFACLAQGAARVMIFDAKKAGVQYTTMDALFSPIYSTIGNAKALLAGSINRPIAGVDVFVGLKGAAVFNAMSQTEFVRTNMSYGDNTSIYRIGSLNDGTNVYFVPESLGWLDEAGAATTANALLVPRSSVPALSPFVGFTAVPPMVLTSNGNPFEQNMGVYARISADRNPNPIYADQGVLIQMISLPPV